MNHREDDEQAALITWARLDNWPVRDLLIAIPNGGKRNPREAARLKKAGVMPGVSDLFLAYPCGGRHGLWIEMKAAKPHNARLTTAQADWLEEMQKMGYEVCCCHGWVEAATGICTYVEPRLPVTAAQMLGSLPLGSVWDGKT